MRILFDRFTHGHAVRLVGQVVSHGYLLEVDIFSQEVMMRSQTSFTGVTVQLKVPDIAVVVFFYSQLLGRKPDFEAHEDFKECELVPMCWLQLAEGTSEPAGRLRLGVDNIGHTREWVQRELGVVCSEVGGISGLAVWSNFEDPWGNHLGLFQDLAVNGIPRAPGGSVYEQHE
jgi:predicted enzyme related to lactoylglutathione lyase